MLVLYHETHLGLPQTICNTNIHERENCGFIQTNYVLGKAVLGRVYCGKPYTFIATSDLRSGNLY